MILIPSALRAFLSQLTCAEGVPHTAILTSSPETSGGSIISYYSVRPRAIAYPFPRPSSAPRLDLECDDEDEAAEDDDDDEGQGEEEARVGMYAALAVGTWSEQRADEPSPEPLTLETEVGRISVVEIGAPGDARGGGVGGSGRFLLILVGTQVSPWKVLDKKIRVAGEYLKEPLSKVST
ncbi:hypothetical protein JCM3766R1_005542 [Sporobolomyces carnicolor]